MVALLAACGQSPELPPSELTVAADAGPDLRGHIPRQSVKIHVGDKDVTYQFHADFVLSYEGEGEDGGRATGVATLQNDQSVLFRFTYFRVEKPGGEIDNILVLGGIYNVPGEDGTDVARDLFEIEWNRDEPDCLIFDLVGGNIHDSAPFGVDGTILALDTADDVGP
jgi:hypothetical protein